MTTIVTTRGAPGERLCGRCGVWQLEGRYHCNSCRAAIAKERENREAARSLANIYYQRGKIQRMGCEVCGGYAEKHHDDYSRPLDVRWLCREHHLLWHAENDPLENFVLGSADD